MVYASDKYVYAYGDSAKGGDLYSFSLFIFSSNSLKLIKVYSLKYCNKYYGFRNNEIKTDVLYWVGYSRLYQFYFESTAYGLKEYVFNSGFVDNEYTKLMMKQVLVNSNINAIIII